MSYRCLPHSLFVRFERVGPHGFDKYFVRKNLFFVSFDFNIHRRMKSAVGDVWSVRTLKRFHLSVVRVYISKIYNTRRRKMDRCGSCPRGYLLCHFPMSRTYWTAAILCGDVNIGINVRWFICHRNYYRFLMRARVACPYILLRRAQIVQIYYYLASHAIEASRWSGHVYGNNLLMNENTC